MDVRNQREITRRKRFREPYALLMETGIRKCEATHCLLPYTFLPLGIPKVKERATSSFSPNWRFALYAAIV